MSARPGGAFAQWDPPRLDRRGQEIQVPQKAQRPIGVDRLPEGQCGRLALLCLASFVFVHCWVDAASRKHQKANQPVTV